MIVPPNSVAPPPTAPLAPFCKLADVARYTPCDWDFSSNPEAGDHWTFFFLRHFNTILNLGVAVATARGESADSAQQRAGACRDEFSRRVERYRADPARHGRVTLLTMDEWRDSTLRSHGFADSFIDVKDRDNATALPCLPEVCRQLDVLDGIDQLTAIVRGVFAGNIFDMGAPATAQAVLGQSHNFHDTRDAIRPRPWLIDDFSALARRMLDGPRHHKAVFFVDNAGSDFILGSLPLIRWLGRRGTKVILAANELPTLNDMTITDVNAWWPRILETEPSLADLPVARVTTGTAEPLLDLAQVSPALNHAAVDADLVILEGMGRGVESNLFAAFSCDAVNLAMIKDDMVAKQRGGQVFDVVCKFRGPA